MTTPTLHLYLKKARDPRDGFGYPLSWLVWNANFASYVTIETLIGRNGQWRRLGNIRKVGLRGETTTPVKGPVQYIVRAYSPNGTFIQKGTSVK